jgi:predicted ABC-type transport system involved in lysophospholipase L1 biosynthesis ATPase subunit
MTDPRADVVLDIRSVQTDYHGLRPLRIQRLELRHGESLALLGFDRATAELFVNLATGAALPDAGDVHVFGQSTSSIADADAWLASLDRFGILSERAVLLDSLTALQNLAMPWTLDVEPLAEAIRARATQLGAEVGLEAGDLIRPVAALPPGARVRVRLGRALALNPVVLLAEHPNAMLSADDVPAFAADYARVVAARGIASLTLSADRTFASAVAERVLTLQPATGELKAAAGWRRWFAGR